MSILDGITRFNPNRLFRSGRKQNYLKNNEIVELLRQAYNAGYYTAFDARTKTPSQAFGNFLDHLRRSVK